VEQAAAAAGSLEDQASRLRDAVGTFRISLGAEPTPQRLRRLAA
jgi:aerotaxis receptor